MAAIESNLIVNYLTKQKSQHRQTTEDNLMMQTGFATRQRSSHKRYKQADIQPGDRIGRLTVQGPAPRINGARASVCMCVCEKVITRRDSTLKMARDQEMEASCGCARNQGALKKKIEEAIALRQSRLTPEEFAQVERICAERRNPNNKDREEAILCVIADRTVGEMVCHQGLTDTI